MDPFSEDEVVALLKKGGQAKERGFHLLVQHFGPMLYRQIRAITKNHELADDILQEVFIKVFRNFDAFKGDSALYTWLYRITRNETLNYLKKENLRTGVDMDESVFEFTNGSSYQEQFSSEDLEEWLNEAIDSLPEKQATVFRLKYFEDLKYSEISKTLKTSEGALKANFHHAKEKIKDFLLSKLNH